MSFLKGDGRNIRGYVVRLWDHGRNDRAKPFVLDRRGRRSLRVGANKVRKSLSSSVAIATPSPSGWAMGADSFVGEWTE